MRVVSGSVKGRMLKAVPGVTTRPTTDKVKEAIFNMIGPYFDEGLALDLFAGSGGLGIEALSRGMQKAIFVDRDGKAIQTIKSNLESCGFENQAEVYRNDADRALKAIIKRDMQLDLILLDPPYKAQKLKALIELISEHHLLSKTGVIVAEHSHDVVLPEQIGLFEKVKGETYGIIAVCIYKYKDDSL
ncbi:16S rRNA (guanine(966)-N(2))-methyltransferase RsmD [Metabacillus iocasae]|uniref:16S rRNA (Guanine(966)-N(2))-methyltransferase RsmD n=1 Tax=Priestia iocasae TaxID=2291674 RepID=A0ABS2QTA9_9BACI|nr:16S rRNA (guanine(966)-N(2))-methyltransferase RsmD [Metabacillus iocasae]MBM7701749.1 16S rRNA (guanine(966)-N(2))-methyltransferase RsmD [Metabacillus iocasae]